MKAHDRRTEDQPDSSNGAPLTDEERRAIQAAAEADGYSESFTELLCRFAELIGTEEVLGELKKMEPRDP